MAQRVRSLVRTLVAIGGALAALVAMVVVAPAAQADTKPPATATPTTVSTDVLATAQINGVAWTQVIVGNTVYVGGDFSTARPSAGAASGSSTVSRKNLLAYNLSTGVLLTTWTPSINGAVRALAASADGSTIYVGGQFTTLNSTSVSYLGAVSASTGATVTSFNPKPNSTVRALAFSGSLLYVGGSFTKVGSTARSRAAAVSTSGAVQSWAASVADGQVNALVVNASLGRVVLGGNFSGLNGNTTSAKGSGMVSTTGGTSNLSWGVGTKVKNWGTDAAILSLTSDGTNVYGTGYIYGSNGNLESTFSGSWSTGNLTWVEDCHGDTYSSAVLGSAVYIAGHPHVCATIGGFPETTPRTWHRGLAFSTAATGTVAHNQEGNYYDWYGNPAPSLLTWFPDFNAGTYTGQSQGPWSVAASGNYVVYGGEFTKVNSKAQQGLVRFAVSSVAPNQDGPQVASGDLTIAVTTSDTSKVLTWTSVWDRDNESLTYTVQRNGTAIGS